MPAPVLIALLGAESTGKTTLAQALVPAITQASGLRTAWVPELLRQWCDERGRTPLQREQQDIMRAQHALIDSVAAQVDVVVCDTTALMTAVYSRIVFGDRSLDAQAIALHRPVALTLLTALDLPWVADGLQREGPHVQGPVDSALRELMATGDIACTVVSGSGEARLAHALSAARSLLAAKNLAY